MRINQWFGLSIVVAMCVASPSAGTPLETLIAQSIDTYQQIESVQNSMRQAVGDLAPQQQTLDAALRALNRSPLPQAELDKLDQRIDRQREHLQRMQENGVPDSALQHNRDRLQELELERQASAVADDTQRNQWRDQWQTERDQLNAQIQEIQRPFETQIKSIRASVKDQNNDLKDALRPYFTAPTTRFPNSTVTHFQANIATAFAAMEWVTSDGDRLVWAHVRIRPMSEIQEHDRKHLLNERYPIRTASDNSVWIWAGHHLITFVPVDDTLKNEAKLLEVLPEFIDLEGLAEVIASTGSEVAEVSTP